MSDCSERALAERFAAGDAGAAMELGRRIAPQDASAADAWFKAAVRARDSSVMHQVIDYLETNPPQDAGLVGVWKRRAARALFPRTDAPHIAVALSTFMPLDGRGVAVGEPDPRLVVQAVDPGAAAAAVRRAVEQFVSVQPTLSFSAVREDELGAHVTIESGPPRFAQLHGLLDAVVIELAAAGVRTAYVRTESSEAWLPSNQPEPSFPAEVARVAAQAAEDPSGEAAFEVGVWCQDNFYRQCGDVWFKKAVAQAPFDMMLRVVDEYATRHYDWNGERLAGWVTRSLRLEFPRVDAPRIRVNGALFAPIVLNDCAGYGQDTSVQVASRQSEEAARALEQAAARFGRVTLDGREFASYEELEAAAPAGEEGWDLYYTPNFVSDVAIDDGHPSLWMDWKDNMSLVMARTMTHILIDELVNAGVSSATIRPRPATAD